MILQIIIVLILTCFLPLINILIKNIFIDNSTRYSKIAHYVLTICITWSLATLIIFSVSLKNKSVKNIGINFNTKILLNSFIKLNHSLPSFIALVLSIIILALSIKGVIGLKNSIFKGLISQEKIETLKRTMPSTFLEKFLFIILSASAGICEEIIYRGFFKYYLSQPPFYITGILYILLSSAAFMLPHIVQGFDGALNSFILGILWATIYQSSNSLLLVMILHIGYDLKLCFMPNLKNIDIKT